MGPLDKLFHFLFGTTDPADSELIEIPSVVKTKHKRLTAAQILGPVKHLKIFVFTITQSGGDHSSCAVCKDPEVTVFSDAIDVLGQKCRMCLRCLEAFGGIEQVELAASRSKYARRWLECVRALKKLKQVFPDPERRPYGDKALDMEIKRPCWGYEGIERILHKIENETWTKMDLLAIQKGRAASVAEKALNDDAG